MRQLKSLTGIRAVAAIWILFFHSSFSQLFHSGSSQPHFFANFLSKTVELGYAAVSLFFVLSGFILTYNYLSRLDRHGSAHPGLRPYFLSRAARIYPTYLLGFLLALLFEGQLFNPSNHPLPGFFTNFLTCVGLQAWLPTQQPWPNFPSWSVSCELFFYAFLPALLSIVRYVRPNRAWSLFLSVGAFTVLMAVVDAYGARLTGLANIFKFLPLLRAFEFVTGATLAYAYVNNEVPRRIVQSPDATILAAIATILFLGIVAEKTPVFLHSGGLALSYAMIIIALAESRGVSNWLLSTTWVVAIGEASYSIYILQSPTKAIMADLWQALRGSDEKAAWFKALTFVVVLLLGLLVGRYFEAPTRRFILHWFGGKVGHGA